jgi:hypothetical protein
MVETFTKYRACRVSAMQRARNCVYYARHSENPRSRELWLASARHAVRTARFFNWYAVARLREYTRAAVALHRQGCAS